MLVTISFHGADLGSSVGVLGCEPPKAENTGTARLEGDITVCIGCGTGPDIVLIVASGEIASGAGIISSCRVTPVPTQWCKLTQVCIPNAHMPFATM